MYTGTFELYDDETDVLRVFTGECEPYNQGGGPGEPRYDWIMELVGPIHELDESGKIVGVVEYGDPLYKQAREAIEADALDEHDREAREPREPW